MKRMVNKTKKLIKGTPIAVLISIAIHATLLIVATSLVIFNLVKMDEVKFVPERYERPKMKLQKPRVRVKDTAKPRKAVSRIASSRPAAISQQVQLPPMTGMGGALEGGIGGFEMVANLSQMTMFGGVQSVGNDLEGTLYYFPLDRLGNPIAEYYPVSGAVNKNFVEILNKFLASGWDEHVFDRFWRAPRKLYATHFMVPPYVSNLANEKFGLPKDTIGASFLIYYKGKISHPTGGKFRFWAGADDLMFIRINGKLVMDGRTANAYWTDEWKTPEKWTSTDPENHQYYFGATVSTVGDWFEIKPGETVEMEVLIGEDQGGRTSAMLNVQQFGVDYPKNQDGAPILPVFKTAPIPPHLVDEIQYGLIEGESSLTNGPTFRAY